MPCYHPIEGYRSRELTALGKRRFVTNPRYGYLDMPLTIPCGQCIGCRLERSRQWAIRCVHESQLHEANCFITLTYRDECLPPGRSLVLDDFQRFMKRFRKRFGAGIRFFHCGEYGEKFQRPHYHACIFNFDFEDKVLWSVRSGVKLYTSEALQDLWPVGFSTVGDVTFESAAYVARYVTKKVTGERSEMHYTIVDPVDGELLGRRKPEYVTMSRRPGIGRLWFDKFRSDVFPKDFVTLRGVKMRPPKFYDSIYELDDPVSFRKVKLLRKLSSQAFEDNNTPDRLRVREFIQHEKFNKLIRGYENGS